MTHDVFISYSSKNKSTADAICNILEQNRIRCWIAPRDIRSGQEYADIIPVAIKSCKIFLSVFSIYSQSSRWVKNETRIAFENEKLIIPFRIDQTIAKGQMEVYLNGNNWIDAYPDPKPLFAKLTHDISIHLFKDNIYETTPHTDFIHRQTEPTMLLKIKSNIDCTVYKDDEFIIETKANRFSKIYLNKGIYSLRFESTKNPDDFIEQIYHVRETGTEDILLIDMNKSIAERAALENCKLSIFYSQDGKFGFIDKNSTIIIAPEYESAHNFYEGIAAVKLNGKWGFINKKGNYIAPCIYDDIWAFHEGIARVKIEDKWGYINKKGQELVPCKYKTIHLFQNGFAAVQINAKWGFIDKYGKEIVPCIYDYAELNKNILAQYLKREANSPDLNK